MISVAGLLIRGNMDKETDQVIWKIAFAVAIFWGVFAETVTGAFGVAAVVFVVAFFGSLFGLSLMAAAGRES